MPNFAAIQQASAAVAGNPVTPPTPAPTAGGRAQASSKRNSRKVSGFYLKPETVLKLKRYVLAQQEAGEKVDASDVVEEALSALLGQKSPEFSRASVALE